MNDDKLIIIIIPDVIFHLSKHIDNQLPILIINFAISNIILAIGFLSYTLIIDIYYQTEIIADSNKKDFNSLTDTTILKEILKYQIVHNFGNIQVLFLLYLATDSYFSLFIEYNPNHQSLIIAMIPLSLPYIISILFIDMRFLQLLTTTTSIIVF
ncbi:hypothetical protein WUBG_12515 [Wuchereria bancrofti]|uniref:Uncharacterized protein n=1 Tax=Wuchereria bancrofti TaxID=6293 RepID=J9E374_WUCBA|nr:hypothetical protein WUBG_12515 [Wuchereria bancrofti]